MTNQEFEEILEAQIKRLQDVLINKTAEYATSRDQLNNFRKAAQLRGCTIPQAVAGMMVKHTVSIFDMVANDYDSVFSEETWDEKITDHIIYLVLLKAAVHEAADKDSP